MESPNPSTAGKPIRCKAAVCRKAGEPLAIEEINVDPPRAREARIRVICTSICNTDVSFWRMTSSPGGFFPRILGHEAVGVVESVGEGVTELKTGDTVVPVFLPDCGGECADCRSENSNLCSKLPFKLSPGMPRDGTSRFADLRGNVIHNFLSVSGFSEYTVVDVAHLTKVDSSAPPERACLLNCGIAAGVGAAWRKANVQKGSTVAIFGLGSIGLAVAEGARLCGAGRVIGIDAYPEKLEMAKKFGVTEFVNPVDCGDKSLSQVINEMTGGGADSCFECAGSPSLMEQAYASCRKGWGKTIVLGVGGEGSEMKLKCMDVLQSGRTLTGALFGGLKPKTHIPILLQRYIHKELELDKFVTHEMEFEDINKAFDLLVEGKCLRCVIWLYRPDQSAACLMPRVV
ncbi:unnamed protein product [Linum tenue]|uniref:alcohol dehydrogenase n=1 Tax=Linum tenue TaxID=586396 RepID=A0AAV0GXI4_9ROSI|nr:unnamed protein product [Linum tenue]